VELGLWELWDAALAGPVLFVNLCVPLRLQAGKCRETPGAHRMAPVGHEAAGVGVRTAPDGSL